MSQTTIFQVLKEDGEATFCTAHPNALLMEVRSGPHKGKRGCDACLFDLAGAICWNRRWASLHETGGVVDAWVLKYVAFQKRGCNHFFGDWIQTVVVSRKTGKVLGHLYGYDNSYVVSDWHPRRDGHYGKVWKKVRPKGWRVCRDQARVLDWALDALSGW